jgi:mxaK protein
MIIRASSTQERLTRVNHPFATRFKNYPRTIYVAAGIFLLISLAALIAAVLTLLAGYSDNRKIAALRADHDVIVNSSAPSEVLFARASFLLFHQRIDETQDLAEVLARRGHQKAFASLLFNLGNARLRQAFELIANGDLDRAPPFVNLAKRNYRHVLELEPDNWNAKYNLDVAMRLVRDYPFGQENEGDTLPASKQLWPDMPGIPEGLP